MKNLDPDSKAGLFIGSDSNIWLCLGVQIYGPAHGPGRKILENIQKFIEQLHENLDF